MRIEGTILKRTRFGRMLCVELQRGRVLVERQVFEDLGSLRVGTEIEAECFENERGRLIATNVQVLRWPEEDVLEQGGEHIDGFHLTVPTSPLEMERKKQKRNWRYRKAT